jgi:transferase CAF17, mitochondrial
MRSLVRSILASPLCRSCRTALRQQQHQRHPKRSYATSIPPPPPASGFTPLETRRVISVSGPDAGKYLQGVITSSIATPEARPREQGFYTSFLSAQGRVLHDVFVYPDTIYKPGHAADGLNDRFLIEVDAAEAERLQKHIKRYKLRAKFDVSLTPPGEVSVWHVWDDGPESRIGNVLRSVDGDVVMRDTRAPGMGYRVLRLGDKAPILATLEMDRSSEEAYRIRRYLHGVPEGQDEIVREHALPQESNMDFMGGIDFHKGCYVGQELTIRTKHRGVVRKRILPVMIYPTTKAAPSQLQYRSASAEGGSDADADTGTVEAVTAEMIPRDTSIGRFGKRGRSAGKWLRGVGNVGLALCRLEIMTDVVLPGETPSSGFSPASEFLLGWGGEDAGSAGGSSAKVKAFVPEWLRKGLAEGNAVS